MVLTQPYACIEGSSCRLCDNRCQSKVRAWFGLFVTATVRLLLKIIKIGLRAAFFMFSTSVLAVKADCNWRVSFGSDVNSEVANGLKLASRIKSKVSEQTALGSSAWLMMIYLRSTWNLGHHVRIIECKGVLMVLDDVTIMPRWKGCRCRNWVAKSYKVNFHHFEIILECFILC